MTLCTCCSFFGCHWGGRLPRIRTIKPEAPQDAKLASVSRDARLTFWYLMTQVDDRGFFRASTRLLIGQLFPHDTDVTETTLARWMNELAAIGRIALFDSEDGPLGQIVNFMKHQKIDHPSSSYLASVSRKPRESLAPIVYSLESRVLSLESVPPTCAKPSEPESFAEFWTAYPRRSGANPRATAVTAYRQRLSEGVTPGTLLGGAVRYEAYMRATDKIGTPFVKTAVAWLAPSFEGWKVDWTAPANGNSAARKETQQERNLRNIDAAFPSKNGDLGGF